MKKPTAYFVNSMSDLFHESVTNEQIAAVFGVMAASPQHTFQVLTKRPELMRKWFDWMREFAMDNRQVGSGPCAHETVIRAAFDALPITEAEKHRLLGEAWDHKTAVQNSSDFESLWPLPNVWLGVSVEDQKTANDRIPLLLQCPAAVRWLSAEPLLGPVNLSNDSMHLRDYCWLTGENYARCQEGSPVPQRRLPSLDWVVVGGESGPGARPFDVAWARSILRECKSAGVPVFVKQLGSNPVVALTDRLPGCLDDADALDAIRDSKGGKPDEWPADLRVREYPR